MKNNIDKTLKIFAVLCFLFAIVFSIQADEKVVSISDVDEKPQLVLKKAPTYPNGAKDLGLTGNVVLQIQIGSDGWVSKVDVVSSEPEGIFEKAAVDAVSKWKFKPASVGGEMVATSVKIPLKFEL